MFSKKLDQYLYNLANLSNNRLIDMNLVCVKKTTAAGFEPAREIPIDF